MQTMVAISLIVLAMLLFLAVKKLWISLINIRIAAAVSTVLAFIATVLLFLNPQQVPVPKIKKPDQTQVFADTTQESGTAIHDTNYNKPAISGKQIEQQVSVPKIKKSDQTQVFADTNQESGITTHDTNYNKPAISGKQIEQKVIDKRAFKLFIDVAPDRAGAKVYIDDVLYANAAPCTVKVEGGTHYLRIEYIDSYSSLPLVYTSSIVISHDDVIRIESEEFKTK